MSHSTEGRPTTATILRVLVVSLLVTGSVAVADLPDLESNPQTGNVESVDIATESNDRVQHVDDAGQGKRGTATLVSSGAAGNPRIAIDSGGDSWVVWWQDAATDAVYFTVRDLGTDSWTQEEQISETAVDSRQPEIVHDGAAAYVGFEADDGAGGTNVVAAIIDDADPIPTLHTIATTTFGGDLDVDVHSESSHVWVTWVDDSTEVGWSEWDETTETWSQPQYESYEGSTVKAAREAIREAVLGM